MKKLKTKAPDGCVISFGKGRKQNRIYIQDGKLYFRASDWGILAWMVDGPPAITLEDEDTPYVREDYAVKVWPILASNLEAIRANLHKKFKAEGRSLINGMLIEN